MTVPNGPQNTALSLAVACSSRTFSQHSGRRPIFQESKTNTDIALNLFFLDCIVSSERPPPAAAKVLNHGS